MTEPAGLPIAEYRRFESTREYEALLDGFIPQTQRAIRIFERRLSRAYNTPARFELLRTFLRSHRENRLFIVVHESNNIDGECSRLVQLSQVFGHAVKIKRTLRLARQIYDPFAIFDASHYLHRFHYDRMRAAVGTHEVNGASELLDRYNELWEASESIAIGGIAGL